jgi:hypothetical protein
MTDRAAQVISLAMGGYSIDHIKARPNRWDGYDLDLERGGLLRVAIEGGEVEVMTFDAAEVLVTKAAFSFACPPWAVSRYLGALL